MIENLKFAFKKANTQSKYRWALIIGLLLSSISGALFAISLYFFAKGLGDNLVYDKSQSVLKVVYFIPTLLILEFASNFIWGIVANFLTNQKKGDLFQVMLFSNEFNPKKQKNDFDQFSQQYYIIISNLEKWVYEISVMAASIFAGIGLGWKLILYIAGLSTIMALLNCLHNIKSSFRDTQFENSLDTATKTIPHIKAIRCLNLHKSIPNPFHDIQQANQKCNAYTLLTGIESLAVDWALISPFYIGYWYIKNNIHVSNKQIKGYLLETLITFFFTLISLWCYILLRRHYRQIKAADAKIKEYCSLRNINLEILTKSPKLKLIPEVENIHTEKVPPIKGEHRYDNIKNEEDKEIINTDREHMAIEEIKENHEVEIREINLSIHRRNVAEVNRYICFSNVSFEYPSNPGKAVLTNINLYIPKSKVTIIMGAHGSGKSTLLHLISGYSAPTQGIIDIEGNSIDEAFTSNMSFIGKGDTIDEDLTIKRNLEFGNVGIGGLTDDECIEAYKCIGIEVTNDIINEPRYLTQLNARRRCILARALIKKPSFLIIDDIFENDFLDFSRIIEAMTVVISSNHSLANIGLEKEENKSLYHIVVLSNGRIVEQGTYKELSENKSSLFNTLNKPIPISELPNEIANEELQINNGISICANIKSLFIHLKQSKCIYYILIIAAIISAIIGVHPELIGWKLSEAYTILFKTNANTEKDVQNIIYYILGISIISFFFYTVRDIIFNKVKNSLKKLYLEKAFSIMINMKFDRLNSEIGTGYSIMGVLNNEVDGMVEYVCMILGNGIEIAICLLACLIGGFPLCKIIAKTVYSALLVDGILIPLIVATVLYEWIGYKLRKQNTIQDNSSDTMLTDCLENKYSIKTLNLSKQKEKYKSLLNRNTLKPWRMSVTNAVYIMLVILFLVIAMEISKRIINKSKGYSSTEYENYSTNYICIFIAFYSLFCINKAIPENIGKLSVVNASLNKILYESNENHKGGDICLPIIGNIQMIGVTFPYPRTTDAVLNQMDLNIPLNKLNKVIALVGNNRCGKSTLLQLLANLYSNYEGEILIDDKSIKDYQISVISNSNLIIPQYSQQIEAFLQNYEPPEQNELSNDQREKINMIESIIADDNILLKKSVILAIIKDPRILLIDEAFTNLTLDQEQQTLQILNSNHPTCIIATQRKSIIKNADYILVMNNGTIEQSGEHEELMRQEQGLYYKKMAY